MNTSQNYTSPLNPNITLAPSQAAGGTPSYPSQYRPIPASTIHSIFRNKYFLLIAIASILIITILLIIFLLIPKNSLTVVDQPAGKFLYIKKLVINRGGFVTIRRANKYKKPSGLVVGNTSYLPPDTYSDIPADLFAAPGEDKVDFTPGEILWALVYEDADNDFQMSTPDAIMKDWLGRQLIKPFKIK